MNKTQDVRKTQNLVNLTTLDQFFFSCLHRRIRQESNHHQSRSKTLSCAVTIASDEWYFARSKVNIHSKFRYTTSTYIAGFLLDNKYWRSGHADSNGIEDTVLIYEINLWDKNIFPDTEAKPKSYNFEDVYDYYADTGEGVYRATSDRVFKDIYHAMQYR